MSNAGASCREVGKTPQNTLRHAVPIPTAHASEAVAAARPCVSHEPPHDSLRGARRAGRWRRPAVAILGLVAVVAAGSFRDGGGATAKRPGAWIRSFAAAPLDTPLVITGMFGERRARHFHAGLDLSTGGATGQPVRAPASGWIERVRAMGNGYGRALYLRTDGGLLVVLAHLDAFAEPVAAFIAAVQDSTGQYEQDLWPPRGRFAVRAGQRVAWSGASGTGQPHLHIEVRRGDMALNPLRAGIPARDLATPSVRQVTLEPLDSGSSVEGGAGPLTMNLPLAGSDTIEVEGRLRAIVRADDAGERGARLAPWRLRESWKGAWIEWRADSASWATDMADVDYVYDFGRAAPAGPHAIQLWAPRGWRPALLASNVPDSLPAGAIEVRAGDPPAPLRFEVEDTRGRRSESTIWLRGPAAGRGRSARHTPVAPGEPAATADRAFAFMSLPGGDLRVSYRGAPDGLRDATILDSPATRRAGAWHVVLGRATLGDVVRPAIRGALAGGVAWADSARPLAVTRGPGRGGLGAAPGLEWTMPANSLFEPATILYDVVGRPAAGTEELAPVSDAFALEPEALPLRSAATVRLDPRRGPLDPRVGLCVEHDGEWDWLGGRDSTGSSVSGGTRQLGRFAAMMDTLAPRVEMLRVARGATAGPYSRWALVARVTEQGSGLDPRASAFIVDGRRVPTEFDGVPGLLRWKPRVRPARGEHAYTLEARDRAGNLRRVDGTFVLD